MKSGSYILGFCLEVHGQVISRAAIKQPILEGFNSTSNYPWTPKYEGSIRALSAVSTRGSRM